MSRQPEPEWIALLREEAARSSVAAVARKLGYSRPAISGVLNGTYRGRTDKIAARVLAVLGRRLLCPHLNAAMHIEECRRWRRRPMPMGSARDLRHWRACQACRAWKEFDNTENDHAA